MTEDGAGITFITPDCEWGGRIWEFLQVHYFPHEPVIRSSRIYDPQSRLYRWFKSFLYSLLVGKTLEKPSSILALDSTTQQILGVKLGAIASISDDDSEAPYFWLDYVDYVACLLPTSLYKALMCEKFMGWLRCDPFLAMEDLGCHKVFHGQLLCVAESARGRGLGRQLVKRSLDMAQANLCEFYFLCATGIYSQSIYQSLGFQVMKCAKYVDHRDRYGRQVIDDPGEHTHAQTMSKALYST